MKKIITPLLIGGLISLSFLSEAQTKFWTETWSGTTCAEGCTSYTGPNGAWKVVPSGRNGADSNVWYFSEMETGMGRGQCGTGGGAPPTAHMGFTTNSSLMWPLYQALNSATYPDQGAVIDDNHNEPSRTNQMIQSPVINCTGKSTISLSFNYIEGKSAGNDYATVWYYDGSSWSMIGTPTENDSCVSNGQGLWTYYKVALPVSANNNANVKIGFNWTNDTLEVDDSAFDNYFVPIVSFAVDSIVMTAATTLSVQTLNDYKNSEIYPNPNKGLFTLRFENIIPNSSVEVYNVLGEKIYQAALSSSDENKINLNNPKSGVYLYRVFSSDRTISSEGKFIVK
jgi:hypothetical protein